jgi:arogenate dehydrogenase (NADP+)
MKIGIIGLGLIGGSLGLDFKAKGLVVNGVSRSLQTCKIAMEKGIVDRASTELEILSDSDIIFICTPISSIVSTIKQLTPHLNTQTVITDVGSVKGAIVRECSPIWDNFIGGHPMAGTAEQGVEAAKFQLFRNAPYVITPTEKTQQNYLDRLVEAIDLLGSKIYICSPEEHDRAVAEVSHLPLIVSVNLIYSCLQEKEKKTLDLAQKLASSGFCDTSRIGGGNPELGVTIAKYNRDELLRSLRKYRQNLDESIETIEACDWERLQTILELTQQHRPKFLNLS